MSCELNIVNDRSEYNYLYRSSLIELLATRGFKPKSIGLYEPRFSLLKMLGLAKSFSTPVVSSNIRTNILILTLFWIKGLVIINGLGRNRRRRGLRLFLSILFRINRQKSIVLQSYADYRYFKMHVKNREFHWIPGSGGRCKSIGKHGNMVIVQRDEKIECVASSIADLLDQLDSCPAVILVGCKDKNLVKRLFPLQQLKSVGPVPSADIFSGGGVFVQPTGYGEGFPHTLADAIVSGMKIYISRIEFTRYGLWRLGVRPKYLAKGWVQFDSNPKISLALEANTIDQSYLDLLIDQIPLLSPRSEPQN